MTGLAEWSDRRIGFRDLRIPVPRSFAPHGGKPSMLSPCPLKVNSIKRRPLRLALFRTGSSLPRLDQDLQGAGKDRHPSSAGIGASTQCGGLCTRASAGTARAVSSSWPTKCPTRSGEVLHPPLARQGPRPGHSRPAAPTTAGEAESIGHRRSSRLLRIKQTRYQRLGSSLVILRAGSLKNSHRRRPQGTSSFPATSLPHIGRWIRDQVWHPETCGLPIDETPKTV